MKMIFCVLISLEATAVDSSLSQERIQNLLTIQNSNFSGPNCHNAAFYASGTLNTIRYVSTIEAEDVYNNENVCINISDQTPISGAIRAIYRLKIDGSRDLIHSQFIIGEEQYFEKEGLHQAEPYRLVNEMDTQNTHTKNTEICKSTNDLESCTFVSEYYLCKATEPIKMSPDKISTLKLLELESQWNGRFFKSDFFNIKLYNEDLNDFDSTFSEQMSLDPRLKIRWDSLRSQAEFLTTPPPIPLKFK